MKAKRQLTARVIAVLLFVALAAGFVFAGVPCLATGPEIVSVISQNTSPIAKNLEFETFKGIAITGKLAATDPDGDEVIFEITDLPNKGSVEAQSDGSFVYTPQEAKEAPTVSLTRLSIRSATDQKQQPSPLISKSNRPM